MQKRDSTAKSFSWTRRQFLAAASAAPFATFGFKARSHVPETLPNIVFIMADDLGYADLSCYGRRDYVTRHIDRLAAEGMKFTQAYSNSPVCSATRTALITGRYQYRLPVGLEEPLTGTRNLGLPPAHPTLPSLLGRAGYATTLIGKWHLGGLPNFGPLKSGYDHFFGVRGGGVDYFTHENGIGIAAKNDLWDDDVNVKRVGYITKLLGDRAVTTIENHAKTRTPFFLSLHFTAPHWPWEGPNDEAESRRLKSLFHFDGGSLKTFAEMVTQMDMQVGRVLATLDQVGLSNNTIVIFTSDNGGERFSDTWPFSGKKTELLEGGVRIPAIVRWPGNIPPASITNQIAISMDWMPTLLEACNTRSDPKYPPDGISLIPALRGTSEKIRRKLFWRYKALSQRAVRDGDMKWLKIGANDFLFNVVEDPLERANLKDKQPDLYHRLISDYERWNATMLPENPTSNSSSMSPADYADHAAAGKSGN